MQFDQFNLYSMMAGKNDEQKELKKVLSYVENFKTISTIEEAKEYLQKTFNVKDLISNYPLGADSYLTIKENDKRFSVSFRYADENQIFSFIKDENN